MTRIFGSAGIIAGALGAVSPFVSARLSAEWLELLYVIIDLGLILGLTGLYLVHMTRLNRIGGGAFIVALCGLALIAGPDAPLFGVSAYLIGTPIIGIGVATFSVALLTAGLGSRLGSVLLVVAFILGAVATVLPQITALAMLSGIVFGLGFIANGVHVFRYAGEPTSATTGMHWVRPGRALGITIVAADPPTRRNSHLNRGLLHARSKT